MYDFVANTRDEHLGIDLVLEFECQIDIGFEGMEPTVDGVYVNGKSLFSSPDPFTTWLAKRVSDAAEKELAEFGPLYAAALEREGIVLCGHPNDPDARLIRRAI